MQSFFSKPILYAKFDFSSESIKVSFNFILLIIFNLKESIDKKDLENHKLCHRFTLRINKQYFSSLKQALNTCKHFLIAFIKKKII